MTLDESDEEFSDVFDAERTGRESYAASPCRRGNALRKREVGWVFCRHFCIPRLG